MADNFYTIQEVMEKLRKTEQEVQDLVKQGTLRQYMDAGKPMFKTQDIDALSQEIVGLDISAIGLEGSGGLELEETSEIQLQPDESAGLPPTPTEEAEPMELKSEGGFGLSQIGDLSMADTNVGTVGINILSGTEDAFKLTEDTKSETQAADAAEIEEIEQLDADSNLESFGSGSGLLDLSLQADDTSLGAVLDDILPTGAEQPAGAEDAAEVPAEQLGLVEESEDLLAEPAMAASPAEAAPMAAVASAPVPPVPGAVTFVPAAQVDPRTNLFGIAMFLPLTAVILAGIILSAAMRGIHPSILNPLVKTQIAGLGLFWYILGALALVAVILSLAAALGGGSETPKPAKVKAEKPKKEKPVKKKGK